MQKRINNIQRKFSHTKPKQITQLAHKIESTVPIYKFGYSLFQIGDLKIDLNYQNKIISLLSLGNKFIPNYFFSKKDYFNNSRIYNSSDKTMNEFKIDNKYFETIYTNFRKNNKKSTNKICRVVNRTFFLNTRIKKFRKNM